MLSVSKLVCLAVGATLVVSLTVAGAKERAVGLSPKETLENWADAWKSGKVEELLEYYEDVPETMAIASSGKSYRGLAEVRKMYESAFDEAIWEHVALEKLTTHEDGNVAWGVCQFRANIVSTADKRPLAFASQGSFVLRKHDGVWRIVLEHFSPIPDVLRVQPRSAE